MTSDDDAYKEPEEFFERFSSAFDKTKHTNEPILDMNFIQFFEEFNSEIKEFKSKLINLQAYIEFFNMYILTSVSIFEHKIHYFHSTPCFHLYYYLIFYYYSIL